MLYVTEDKEYIEYLLENFDQGMGWTTTVSSCSPTDWYPQANSEVKDV